MAGKTFEIVLVEDNFDHAEMVKRALHDHSLSYNIVHLPDGEAALNYLFCRKAQDPSASFVTPQLILLDLRLPKVDGLEVLERVRSAERFDGIPVVVLTTSANDKDIDLAYRYKANSYLVKPVDCGKFQDLLRDLGSYWLIHNQGIVRTVTYSSEALE